MAAKFHEHAEPTLHGCSARDCSKPTTTAYCSDHAVYCESCGAEEETLVNGSCARCLRLECDDEREQYASWRCFCGQHVESDEYGDGGLGMPSLGARRFG